MKRRSVIGLVIDSPEKMGLSTDERLVTLLGVVLAEPRHSCEGGAFNRRMPDHQQLCSVSFGSESESHRVGRLQSPLKSASTFVGNDEQGASPLRRSSLAPPHHMQQSHSCFNLHP